MLATPGMAAALCATSAPHAGSRSACSNERAASGGDALDRIVQCEPARLQQFIEFAGEVVGDQGLQLGETGEVHIEGALRHAGCGNHVFHRHLIERSFPIKPARRRKQFGAGARAAVAADLGASGEINSGHVRLRVRPPHFSY